MSNICANRELRLRWGPEHSLEVAGGLRTLCMIATAPYNPARLSLTTEPSSRSCCFDHAHAAVNGMCLPRLLRISIKQWLSFQHRSRILRSDRVVDICSLVLDPHATIVSPRDWKAVKFCRCLEPFLGRGHWVTNNKTNG